MVDRPAPDPAALLEEWLQWERGEVEPGRLLANLKKGGMKELLEELASAKTGSSD
jgi:hypothetical protein